MPHALNPYRASSRRHRIAEHYLAGDSENWAFSRLKPLVYSGELPFSKNVNGRRAPAGTAEQLEMLERTITTTYRGMADSPSRREARERAFRERQNDRSPMPSLAAEIKAQSDAREARQREVKAMEEMFDRAAAQKARDSEIKQLTDTPRKRLSPAVEMLSWIQETLRPFAESRNADGESFDEIGLRPAENAAKMLRQGITPHAIKHALTLHYPAEARRALKVETYDPTTFEPAPSDTFEPPENVKALSGTHKALPYVKALALSGLPVALVGPPGTGKTTLARQLADDLSAEFGMVSMTRGTSPSAFNGRPKIGGDGGVIQSQFERIYRDGGVFLFDEMDASEPNLLLLVNAALANGHFANAATGEMVPRAHNFIPMAGMNTLGLGGDRKMVGREKLDAATLDRWHAGRVEIKLDRDLETAIFWRTLTEFKVAA